MNDLFIMHYGVGHDKGGHSGRYPWGSGKAQYKNRKMLPKGTEFGSVVGYYSKPYFFQLDKSYKKDAKYLLNRKDPAKINGNKSMYTYRMDNKWDRKVYNGAYSEGLRVNSGYKFVREFRYRALQDFKMPTEKERYDTFKSLDREQLSIDLNAARDWLIKQGGTPAARDPKFKDDILKADFNTFKTDKDWKTAYSFWTIFSGDVGQMKSTKEFMNKMEQKYDAMVDDNNADVYRKATDPIIIFNPAKTLAFIDEYKDDTVKGFLDDKTIIRNRSEMEDEFNKAGLNKFGRKE